MSRSPEDRQQSFVLFGEHWAGLSILTDAQRGRLLQALFAWHGFCEEPELDQATQAVMAMMLPRMKANWELYQESRKRRQEAGRKGGLAGAKPSEQEQPEAMLSNAKQCLATPSSGEQCQHGTGTGSVYGTGSGILKDTPPYPPEGGAPEQARPKRAPRSTRLLEFEQWYSAYPKHTKRAEAQKSWEKAAKAGELPPLAELLETLKWQKTQRTWADVQYIPNPASYLNGKQWTDEPLKPAPNAPQKAQPLRVSPEQEAYERTRQNFADYFAGLEGSKEEPHD